MQFILRDRNRTGIESPVRQLVINTHPNASFVVMHIEHADDGKVAIDKDELAVVLRAIAAGEQV